MTYSPAHRQQKSGRDGLATGLIIGGAVSEAVGILLVAFDVWEGGRQRRELSRGAQPEREKRAHGEILDRVAEWVGEARREVFDLRQEIRPLIGRAVAGRLWLRVIGVGAFLVGLGLQTAGNLL